MVLRIRQILSPIGELPELGNQVDENFLPSGLSPGDAAALMSTVQLNCYSCGGEVELIDKVKRADTCEHCGHDLHCCKNCNFYDPYAHNSCRESSTLYEPDKEKANFCTHFTVRIGKIEVADKGAALSKLDALFKKK